MAMSYEAMSRVDVQAMSPTPLPPHASRWSSAEQRWSSAVDVLSDDLGPEPWKSDVIGGVAPCWGGVFGLLIAFCAMTGVVLVWQVAMAVLRHFWPA